MARRTDHPRSQDRPDQIRILIVDEDRLLAEALELVLASEGISVIGNGSPGPDVVDDVRRNLPDVVLLGVDTPTPTDVRRGQMIVDACQTSRILVLASNIDRSHVQRVSRAGLHACIRKDVSVAELVRAVRALANGVKTPRTGHASASSNGAVDHPAGSPTAKLTPRELEVLKLVATGAAGRAIARRLGISENTVRTHSQSILEKLEVHSRLEAAAYAIENGLVRLGSSDEDELAG